MKALSTAIGLALALSASLAAAATLSVGSKSLSAGNASVTSCGISSLTATRSVDNAGNVTQVNVSGIPAACTGETISVTLRGANASSSVAIGGTSATLTGFGTVSASSVTGYAFAVEGS
jgi:uncharacterized Zn-binding protein involved in type VI secretion